LQLTSRESRKQEIGGVGTHMSQAELREKAVNTAAAISQVGICGKQEISSMGTHMSQAELREKAVNTAAAISPVGSFETFIKFSCK
jgi:hypothetical protein